MRRILIVLIILMMMPQMPAKASEKPFNFYLDEDIIIHPGETVPFRIAWHNIVGFERHFEISIDEKHENLTIDNIPENGTRVASGRLGEMNINLTTESNSDYETIQFSLLITCQEIPDWNETFAVDVIVSRWSSLAFGANDGSSFYVQQNVNTSLAVNISNTAGFDDFVKISMNTSSDWEFGFVGDTNGDNEVHIDLLNGTDVFIYFWIITPSVQDGAPLAGTGPTFHLEAESGLDRQISSWTFGLEMQTFHNMTIDYVDSNLSLNPEENGRIEVTIRNNGNIETYLDAALRIGSVIDDRIEQDGWTIALFNAFEFQILSPNESRTIEIGFDAPNLNAGMVEVELIVRPLAYQQRVSTVSVSAELEWQRGGTLALEGNSCLSVMWNQTCQQMINIQNTGNYYDEFSLHLVDEIGMNFEITSEIIGLSRDESSGNIPLNMTPFIGADGMLPASVTLELHRIDGVVLDSLSTTTSTSPNVKWVWEDAKSSVNNGKLEIVFTMRNDGNTADGLIVRMSTSYYTEMSFIPPADSIVEEGSTNIRSFEIIDCAMGENFTFRAWANIPDNQGASDDFFLNITAHSRLAEEYPFTYSVNSSCDAMEQTEESDSSVINSLSDLISDVGSLFWAWKWILMAALVSGIMINKSLRDRQARLEEAALMAPLPQENKNSDNWLEEFATKKQTVPEPVSSPTIPEQAFKGMFQAISGPTKPSSEPVDANLIGAASTVLDHHDTVATRTRLDNLATGIATDGISKPHTANVALPDDIVPVTDRTVPKEKVIDDIPDMVDLSDLDL